MVERRSLLGGIQPPTPPLDAKVEKAFIYGKSLPTPETSSVVATPTAARSPLSTRIRSDFAAALKRASLERQLNSIEPNTLQDILEAAIEPWLKANGYLS